MQDDKVFEQLVEMTEIRMDPERKLFIRAELQDRIEAKRPKTGLAQKLRALAPIGVGSAAVVLAGGVIVGVLTHKDGATAKPAPVNATLRQTAGSVAAGPSGNTFAANNTWFFVTMGILVAAMVVVFLTRHRAVRRVWVQEILDVLRSPMLWGTALGVVVGIRGIPVTVPSYGSYWVWEAPSGSYVISVTGLGTVGCLIGATIQFGIRKVVPGRVAFWGLVLPAIALLIGMIGFYRGQARTEDNLWGLARNGLEHVDAVGFSLPGHTSQADWRSYGAQLITAADDLGAVSWYSGRYGVHGNLTGAAQVLEEAGYDLVNSNDLQKLKQAEIVARQAAAIVRKVAVATHGNVDAQNMPQLFDEIAKIAPSDYPGYAPN